jgi:hypothetical protein
MIPAGRPARRSPRSADAEGHFSTSIISPPKKKDWSEEVLGGFTREGFESLLASGKHSREPEKSKDAPVLEKKGSRYLVHLW